MKRTILAVTFLAAVSCVKKVDPAADTGEDGEYDDSTPITLDATTHSGEAEDTVSYPGGDRVDWYSVDVGNQKGQLSVELKWEGPRPGADLSFIAYAAWGDKLASKGPARHPSHSKRGHKDDIAKPAFGTVYIEVYASQRSDAGDYTLAVTYTPDKPPLPPIDIPEPPKLAAVPPICTKANWDATNPECAGIPDPSKQTAPTPALKCDVAHLDPTLEDCVQYYDPCDQTALDCKNPRCGGMSSTPVGVLAELSQHSASDYGTDLTFALGADGGLTKDWTGYLVDASNVKLEKSDLQFRKIKKTATDARVKAKNVTDSYSAIVFPPSASCPKAVFRKP